MQVEDLPLKIKEIEQQIFGIENQMFEVIEQLKLVEVPTRISICDELVNGKSKYSNEQRREDELWLRLQNTEDYKKYNTMKKQLLSERDNLKIELEFYKNTLRVMTRERL